MQFIDWVTHTLNLKSNPFSGTLVLGWVLTMLGYWGRKLPELLFNLFLRTFSRELSFDDYSNWYVSQRIYRNFMRLAENTAVTNSWATRFTINYLERDGCITPTVGTQPFWYKGVFGTFRVVENVPQNVTDGGFQGTRHNVAVRLFTRKRRILEELAKDLNKIPKENTGRTIYTSGEYGGLIFMQHNPSMGLDSLVLNEAVLTQIRERIHFFQHNRQWYKDRGIPYKLCILLYGPPGTGKTKLATAIGHALDKHIYVPSPIDERGLNIGLRSSEMADGNLIILLEEIDSVFNAISKEYKAYSNDADSKTSDMLSRTTLLSTLDGSMTPEGMVVIMTTNHIEVLDDALIRPSRVDLAIHVQPFNAKEAMTLARTFYGHETPFEESQFPNGLTGAQVQNTFLMYPDNAAHFIKELWKLDAARTPKNAMKAVV